MSNNKREEEKKEEERNILNMIFSDEYFTIKGDEEPDFILSTKKDKYEFGVEITEFFYKEANARLYNIPNYINIFTNPEGNNRKPHKKDRNKFDVKIATAINENNNSIFSINGIVEKCLSPKEKGDKLAECIIKKEGRLKSYKNKINTNYLVIYDKESILDGEDPNKFNIIISGNNLNKVFSESGFKEIYLITNSKDNLIYYSLIQSDLKNKFYKAQLFSNYYFTEFRDKLYCCLNILYNFGYRFKLTFNSEVKKYAISYNDCIIEFYKDEDLNIRMSNCLIIDRRFTGVDIDNRIRGTFNGSTQEFKKIANIFNNFIKDGNINVICGFRRI